MDTEEGETIEKQSSIELKHLEEKLIEMGADNRLPMEKTMSNKNQTLLHIWYLIISQYLRKEDIYYLCVAYPFIRETFVDICNTICYRVQKEYDWLCTYCFRRFNNYEDFINRYYSNNHRIYSGAEEEYNTYKITCNLDLFISSALRTKYPTMTYNCSFCSEESFGTKKRLLKHFVDRHLAVRCTLCPRRWTEGGMKLLQSPMHRDHRTPKHFTCSICYKQYYYKTSLRRHEKTHDKKHYQSQV